VAADEGEGHPVTGLNWLTASEIGAAYRAKKLSPVELVKALVAEVEAHNADCGAFIRIDPEGALAAARHAEADIMAGRALGPLHGIPVGVKDNIDFAGVPTTCHSKILLDNVAKEDAACVANLRGAGAIMLGKQSLHEFAFGGPSKELPFPFARHPWNTDYHPGGSSSGSGVALAAGFVPLSVGTDAGGSIRNPAGNCGVVGLKPTYDLVSRRGVFPVAFTLDHVGPMARSVADTALLLDGLVGPRRERSFAADLGRGVRGLRIGFVRQWHETDFVADPEVMAALNEVDRVLRQEGAEVRTVALPKVQEMAAVQRIILLAETWAVHAEWLRERPQDYSTPCRRKVMPGAFLSAGDYVNAQQWRRRMIEAVDDALGEVDVLLTASGMDPPFRIDDGPGLLKTYPRQGRSPFNLTGHPAIAMQSGLSKRLGLPLSVQFVGRAYDEITLLRVAAAYERATQWSRHRPPMYQSSTRREPAAVTA
jgi:aspartyl-tRNA(Asn)/glutamyl-tRNA(Gln) amidotransferase subunit A